MFLLLKRFYPESAVLPLDDSPKAIDQLEVRPNPSILNDLSLYHKK
jgi:hypothetical protein